MYSTATFSVEAATEEEALQELKSVTRDLELRIQVGKRRPVQFVNLTRRDDDPEVVCEY